jgi:methyltransferase
MSILWILVGFVIVQRLAELVLARRNARRLLADGGVESGAKHYPLFILLHGGWLLALLILVPPDASANPALVSLFVVLQGLRVWIIASLGQHWTTRIIVIPGKPLVRCGPYRWIRHPNYLVVAAEIAVLPLVFAAWKIAIVFSLLNTALLAWRIRVENEALRRQPTN